MWKAILCFLYEPWILSYNKSFTRIIRTCSRCKRQELFAFGMWHKLPRKSKVD